MEQDEEFQLRLAAYRQALAGFSGLLKVDLTPFEAKIVDGLKNGQAQKFEYTAELTWKMIRRFLLLKDAVEANSPKGAVKEFYLAGYVDEPDYEALAAMLDDRNRLSHIYKAAEFEEILLRLPVYVRLMEKCLHIMGLGT
jgi:nucleotidyltransferase substrate binding protein (TIGR01987 family)